MFSGQVIAAKIFKRELLEKSSKNQALRNGCAFSKSFK